MTCPLGSPRLFGIDDARLDRVLTMGLVSLIAVSRIAAFPASIWEQDEAVFASAVMTFDPTGNLPHPPWFPLWIGLGKVVHLLGVDPATSLCLLSAAISVWMVFPLTSMWSNVLPRSQAVGAALLVLAAPGPWWLSGRAFSGTTATAFLAAALAFWLRAGPHSRSTAAGAAAAACAVLVRPQLLPAAVGSFALCLGRMTPEQRRTAVAAFAAPLLVVAIVLSITAGGLAPLWRALEVHATAHVSQLADANKNIAGSGVSRSLGHPAAAAVWSVLLLIGTVRLVRRDRWRELAPVLVGAALTTTVVVEFLSDPTHARYAIPILAFTAGPVIAGLEMIARRWTPAVVVAVIVGSAAFVGPQLTAYRAIASPPVAALEHAVGEARSRDGTLVVDRRLSAFVVERELVRPVGVPVLFDHMIERDWAVPPPPERTVFVFDRSHDAILADAAEQRLFTTDLPLARLLAQDRFLDVEVASGASLQSVP